MAFLMVVVSSETVVASESWLVFRSLTVVCSVVTAAVFSRGRLLLRLGVGFSLVGRGAAHRRRPAAPAATAHPWRRDRSSGCRSGPGNLGAQRLNLLLRPKVPEGSRPFFAGTCFFAGAVGLAGLGVGNNETGCQNCRGSRVECEVSFGPLCSFGMVPELWPCPRALVSHPVFCIADTSMNRKNLHYSHRRRTTRR